MSSYHSPQFKYMNFHIFTCITVLCSYKCCFIAVLQKGFTPLHEAARNGHVRIVEILLKYYDNPDPEGKVSELLYVGIISSKLMAAW